jgi:hypothetical protein
MSRERTLPGQGTDQVMLRAYNQPNAALWE